MAQEAEEQRGKEDHQADWIHKVGKFEEVNCREEQALQNQRFCQCAFAAFEILSEAGLKVTAEEHFFRNRCDDQVAEELFE